MPQVISATEARESFAEIINRVLYRGEEFIVEKQGKPAAFITRVEGAKMEKDKKKITGIEFLLELTKFHLKGPKDLAKNHDKYTWE